MCSKLGIFAHSIFYYSVSLHLRSYFSLIGDKVAKIVQHYAHTLTKMHSKRSAKLKLRYTKAEKYSFQVLNKTLKYFHVFKCNLNLLLLLLLLSWLNFQCKKE